MKHDLAALESIGESALIADIDPPKLGLAG
jgi:hypothetical protein